MFYKDETLAAFVDGPNFYATARALGIDVDYRRLLDLLQSRGRLLRASYFTPVAETDDHVAIRPMIDWMQYNGWSVVTKPARLHEAEDGRTRIRGNTDVELAVTALQLAPGFDHAMLFSGNRDFLALVEHLQRLGKRVTVVSSIRSQPPMMADQMRRQADGFVDLDTLRDAISRPDRSDAAA